MTWIIWLGIAVVITALAAVTGIKPRGTQHLAHAHDGNGPDLSLHIDRRLRLPGLSCSYRLTGQSVGYHTPSTSPIRVTSSTHRWSS